MAIVEWEVSSILRTRKSYNNVVLENVIVHQADNLTVYLLVLYFLARGFGEASSRLARLSTARFIRGTENSTTSTPMRVSSLTITFF